jgi:hypothetical protein
MTDQTTNEKKAPKTKTLGHIDVAKLEALPEWKAFAKHAERMKLATDTVIEFSESGGRVTVIEVLERKQPKRAQASDMSSLF